MMWKQWVFQRLPIWPSQRRVKELRTLQSWCRNPRCLQKPKWLFMQLKSTFAAVHLAGSINSDIGRWKNISPSSCESRPMVPSLQKVPPARPCEVAVEYPDELLDPKRQSKLRCFLQALPRRRWKAPPMYHSSGWNPLLLKYPRKTSSLKLFKESTGKQLSVSHSEWFWMLFFGVLPCFSFLFGFSKLSDFVFYLTFFMF